jgi:hypothetical protein
MQKLDLLGRAAQLGDFNKKHHIARAAKRGRAL